MSADCTAAIRAAEIVANATDALYAAKKHKEALDEATAAQYEIAQLIQDRANKVHDVWKNHYLPCELATLQTICAEPRYTTDHTAIHTEESAAVARRFALAVAVEQAIRPKCVVMPCETGHMPTRDQQQAQAWQVNSSLRASEAREYVQNAQRTTNKMNMVNIGRHGVAASATAMSAAAKIYKDLADQAAGAFNSALKTAGRTLQQLPAALTGLLANRPPDGTTAAQETFRRAERAADSGYYSTTDAQETFRRAERVSNTYGEPQTIPTTLPLAEVSMINYNPTDGRPM